MIGALNANDRDSVGQFVAYLVGATGTEMGSQPNGPEQFMSYIESLRDNLVAHFTALMDANDCSRAPLASRWRIGYGA